MPRSPTRRGSTDSLPWERLPGESSPAFEAFRAYRDQPAGARSIRRVGRELDKSSSLVGRWSSDWHWQRRIVAFDDEQDRIQLGERQQ